MTAPGPAIRIDSASNPRVRAALALRNRRDRETARRTLVDGAREATRAVDAGIRILAAYLVADGASEAARSAARAAVAAGAELVELGPRAFERLAYGDRADGIVLEVEAPLTSLETLALGLLDHPPLLVVTEDVEKPGNLGAILRSADGAGADGVIAVGGTDVYNPNVIRASAGTVFAVGLATAPADRARAWLREQDVQVVAARVDGSRLYTEANLTGPLAILLGSEAAGLSDTWRGPDIEAVRLPMLGMADSLNVAAAGAILLYEARRQRDAAETGDTGIPT
ncbi:MAG TPA: TrmH family RNA methyltransferase [Candidatus Limnocylindrales bacterium]|nr:TrmH family RNA methyltransferase [Candidatus Limnocylindrales bacterium]